MVYKRYRPFTLHSLLRLRPCDWQKVAEQKKPIWRPKRTFSVKCWRMFWNTNSFRWDAVVSYCVGCFCHHGRSLNSSIVPASMWCSFQGFDMITKRATGFFRLNTNLALLFWYGWRLPSKWPRPFRQAKSRSWYLWAYAWMICEVTSPLPLKNNNKIITKEH